MKHVCLDKSMDDFFPFRIFNASILNTICDVNPQSQRAPPLSASTTQKTGKVDIKFEIDNMYLVHQLDFLYKISLQVMELEPMQACGSLSLAKMFSYIRKLRVRSCAPFSSASTNIFFPTHHTHRTHQSPYYINIPLYRSGWPRCV